MTRFIRVTNEDGDPYRVNVDYIQAYYSGPGNPDGSTLTTLLLPGEDELHVLETADEIDKLLDPTGTR